MVSFDLVGSGAWMRGRSGLGCLRVLACEAGRRDWASRNRGNCSAAADKWTDCLHDA